MESGILSSITSVLELHPYAFLFIGLLFAGESLLLPAIYLAFSEKLSLSWVVAVSVCATVISDAFWYFAGLHANEKLFSKMIEGRVRRGIESLSGSFARNSSGILYLSKFVYGTRVVAQVLAGISKMSFPKYLLVNTIGIVSLVGSIVLLAILVEESVQSIGALVHKAEVALLALIATVVLSHLAIGAYLKKRWSRR